MKALIIFLIFFSIKSQACSLTSDSSWMWTPEQLVQKTKTIMVAKVTSTTTSKHETGIELTEYKMKPGNVLKGEFKDKEFTLKLFGKPLTTEKFKQISITPFCAPEAGLKKEAEYVVFVDAFNPKAIQPLTHDGLKEIQKYLKKK